MKLFPAMALASALLLSACSKDPGEGGKAEIQGVIYQQDYNKNSCLVVGVPAPIGDHKVFISYGDNEYPDDDVDTSPDGKFRFPWLRKGSYKIYTFTECCSGTCPGNQEAIIVSTSIDGRKDVVEIPLITVKWYD
ncbi:MAG: hypothetical protein KA408_07160 [Flavobacteriales bacterium]|nr:hypothetical protein [Flavobacteriales bacterium]